MKVEPSPGVLSTRDRAVHALDDALGNGEAEAGAAELARRASRRPARNRGRCAPGPRGSMPMPVSRTEKADRRLSRSPGSTIDRDAAALGELDGVAGEIEQHLAQARGVADDVCAAGARRRRTRSRCPWPARAARAVRRRLLDQRGERERPRFQIELAGLDLGEIENLLDQRQQRFARGLGRLGVGRLLGRERRVEQQIGHAEHAVERRADLVADVARKRDLARLAASAWSRACAERALGLDAVGDVAADALHFGAGARLRTATSRQAIQRAPSPRGDLLVVDAGAVSEHGCIALCSSTGSAATACRVRRCAACRASAQKASLA